jgi:hypothetical protein
MMDFKEGLAEGLRDFFQKRSGQSCHDEKEVALQPKNLTAKCASSSSLALGKNSNAIITAKAIIPRRKTTASRFRAKKSCTSEI